MFITLLQNPQIHDPYPCRTKVPELLQGSHSKYLMEIQHSLANLRMWQLHLDLSNYYAEDKWELLFIWDTEAEILYTYHQNSPAQWSICFFGQFS